MGSKIVDASFKHNLSQRNNDDENDDDHDDNHDDMVMMMTMMVFAHPIP